MSKAATVPEPNSGLIFIDVHCHLPFPRPRHDSLPSDEEQYREYLAQGGLYLITSSIDMATLRMVLKFTQDKSKMGICAGWAPQTVTYTSIERYDKEWKEWIAFVKNNPQKFLAIGEIGLDFHHATDLEKRNRQVEELKKILEYTKPLNKPYVLHVRNAANKEKDFKHQNHKFNERDGANKEVITILKEFGIAPSRVLWHCFSGPAQYGISLPKQGFMLSVPSSAYGNNRWRKATKDAPIDSLMTETDSYYQHPYLRGPVNVPSNVRYAIAAIAHSHQISQDEVSKKTIQNASKFFNINI
jgi:TatD DNase family protein